MLEIRRAGLAWPLGRPLGRCARGVAQFRLPQTDCTTGAGRARAQTRRVLDPAACALRDRGLVLGVYHDERAGAASSAGVLTASAQRYDKRVGGRLWRALKLSPVPRLGDCRVFYDLDPYYGYVAVAGLGSECLAWNGSERLDESREAVRVAAATAATALRGLEPTRLDVEALGDPEAAAEGAALALWRFTEYRRREKVPHRGTPLLHLYEDCDVDGWRMGLMKAEAQNLARHLQEMPANILNPTEFAKIAVDLLCELDVNVQVRTKGWASAHGMGGFVAIGQSSVQPPLYVELSYYGAAESARPVVLIGKGVTFDSGSLELRGRRELRDMRGDMAGAACVLAAVRAAARLRLPVNLRGVLPLCELMPSGRSPKFGDVVGTGDGGSVRVRLPAREGRLLVADSLVHARSYWPRFVLDVGTMSRELQAALDGGASACFSNCDELFCHAERAGAHTGDRLWRMPLWRFFEERVRDCASADLANTARHRDGGPADCAAYLRQFVCDCKWLHLDTYGVAFSRGGEAPYQPRGMTGRPTRTLVELFCQLLAAGKL